MQHEPKYTLLSVLKRHVVTPERLLITFHTSHLIHLIFPGLEDGTAQGVALSFTNNHLNLATKETQVLPNSQLMRERLEEGVLDSACDSVIVILVRPCWQQSSLLDSFVLLFELTALLLHIHLITTEFSIVEEDTVCPLRGCERLWSCLFLGNLPFYVYAICSTDVLTRFDKHRHKCDAAIKSHLIGPQE